MATDAEVYLASDSNGQNRVTLIQEGDEVWIVVYDPDENIDCDDLDKISPDIKLMDPKTGAYIVWARNLNFDPDNPNPANEDYLIETGPDTGVFVSNRSFQIGTRVVYNVPRRNTHVVDDVVAAGGGLAALFAADMHFQWGHYLYDTGVAGANNVAGDDRGWFSNMGVFTVGRMGPNVVPFLPPVCSGCCPEGYLLGRFENIDTLVLAYQDVNDASDVAMSLAKIIDTEGTISWGQEVYKDANGAAQITVVDADENLNCNAIEYVPVFILVNPGSWNVQTGSRVNTFCQLKRTGGVNPTARLADGPLLNVPIRWFNIYDSGLGGNLLVAPNAQLDSQGTYYIQYPIAPLAAPQVTVFNTADPLGYAQVMFWAQETGVNTGVFRLQLNSLLRDLGFTSLDVRDVLVAYYLDPNDFDDFKLATAYIEEHQHSITSFIDSTRVDQSMYWIGRDPIYVQVIDSNANVDPCCPEQVLVHICDPHEEDDSEWALLDETSSNSPVFYTHSGMELLPVWDALGVGLVAFQGGYQLQLDNWKFEVYNEDDVYARYNDVYYNEDVNTGMAGLGDSNWNTAFPPTINRVRVDNDVSFDVMSIGDTQVYDGTTTQMYFRDRQANRVSGYVNSDCVFIEVVDPDQDEDQYRRERIDGFWDGTANVGQNIPFGPVALNWLDCGVPQGAQTHPVNALLGDTHIIDNVAAGDNGGMPKLYVLNPHNGYWRAIDLMETTINSGIFVSTICIDLVSQYVCAPTLGVLPGDTIIAVYQDPSNHSDSAWIAIKVGVGGGGTTPGQASTTKFADASGNVVTQYTDADSVYVKVVDPSHSGATSLLQAVEIDGTMFDLAPLSGATTDTFITAAISQTDLGVGAGDSITATYTDPVDTTDSSSDTVSIIASVLDVTGVIAKPNPFETETTFAFAEGSTGLADTFSVTVYDLSGHSVWTETVANANAIVWDGTNEAGASLANGPYIFVAVASDGTDTFTYKGTVFIKQ